jgi:hypothetical protein
LSSAAGLALLAVAGVLTACDSGKASSTQAAPAPKLAAVEVTRDNTSYPTRCRPLSAARTVLRFFDLQGSGDGAAAARHFRPGRAPDAGGFYSVSNPGAGVTANTAEQLKRYLAARHRKHERLRLVELSVSYDPRRGISGLDYKIARRADDVPRGRGQWNTEGKGSIDCDSGSIIAWAMSTVPPRERTGRSCPLPAASGARRVVACAAR